MLFVRGTETAGSNFSFSFVLHNIKTTALRHYCYASCLIVMLSRFINNEGGPVHNIPAELHMEHLSRLLKGTVSHLGAKKTPQAIVRAGQVLGVLRNILVEFDKATVGQVTSNHTTRSEAEDLMKMVAELSHHDVFSHHPGRKNKTSPTFECNRLMKSINQKKLDLWMTKKVCKILKLSPLSR